MDMVYLGHIVGNKTEKSITSSRHTIQKEPSEWIVVENTHEPIVSQSLFEQANAMTPQRRLKKQLERNQKFYLYVDIVGKHFRRIPPIIRIIIAEVNLLVRILYAMVLSLIKKFWKIIY